MLAPVLVHEVSVDRAACRQRTVGTSTGKMPSGESMSGHLLYIVGPSGAGKDALLDYARARLPAGSAVRFVRRWITLPARLERRAREMPVEIERRLSRASQFPPPEGVAVLEIGNDQALEVAGEAMLEVIRHPRRS